jgi:tetratricopeptide (TPR) repeat protein
MEYILIYIIVSGLIIIIFLGVRKSKREMASPYMIIQKKLSEDLMQVNFSGDWKNRQEINLQLLWLKTIKDISMRGFFGQKKEGSELEILSKLSESEIRFPIKWNLNPMDKYSYPFSQEIIRSYASTLIEKNKLDVFYHPDKNLPVPKDIIRKAILFTFDYLNLERTLYVIPDKDKFANNLDGIKLDLFLTFINTGDEDLPTDPDKNIDVGAVLNERQREEYDELKELNLIDWGDEDYWIKKGKRYMNRGLYNHAFFCFDKVKEINPDNSNLKILLGVTYLAIGEEHFDKGEINEAIECMSKATTYGNEEADKWLIEYRNRTNKPTDEVINKHSSEVQPTEPIKKRSILDGPMQRRVFEKMGTIYKVGKSDTDDKKDKDT